MCEGYTVHHDGAPSKVRHLSSAASDWQGNVPGQSGEGSGNILSHMHRLHTYKYTCTQVVHMHSYQGNDEARGQLKCMFLDHHILQTHKKRQMMSTHYLALRLVASTERHNHRTMRQGN